MGVRVHERRRVGQRHLPVVGVGRGQLGLVNRPSAVSAPARDTAPSIIAYALVGLLAEQHKGARRLAVVDHGVGLEDACRHPHAGGGQGVGVFANSI